MGVSGIGVAVGVSTIGVAVAVGGTAVAVAVGVSGTGVAVGVSTTGVAVGVSMTGIGVAVGVSWMGVAVGVSATGVAVGVSCAYAPSDPQTTNTAIVMRAKRTMLRMICFFLSRPRVHNNFHRTHNYVPCSPNTHVWTRTYEYDAHRSHCQGKSDRKCLKLWIIDRWGVRGTPIHAHSAFLRPPHHRHLAIQAPQIARHSAVNACNLATEDLAIAAGCIMFVNRRTLDI